MSELIFSTDKERTTIFIDGNPYIFEIFLSTDDCIALIEEMEKDADSCRAAVASYIHRQIIPGESTPSIERIVLQDDRFFQGIIQLLLKDDEHLLTHFEERKDVPDICYRFILAISDTHNELTSNKLKEKLHISPAINIQLPPSPFANLNFRNPQLEKLGKLIQNPIPKNTFTNSFNYHFPSIMPEAIKQILDSIEFVTKQISSALTLIHIPEYSEEQKQRISNAHKEWGTFGWTLPPSAPMKLFSTSPADRKDANKKALAYCKPEDMEKIFASLHNMSGVKKSDLDEAIFDFNHKQYKSCSLVLFGLIDAKLIRAQVIEQKSSNKGRATGKTAAEKLFNRIKKKYNLKETVLLLFFYQNVSSCMRALFADGNDFKTQPDLINRNFIDHGMLTRKVSRKDCVQLFLLYYNFLEFMDIFWD